MGDGGWGLPSHGDRVSVWGDESLGVDGGNVLGGTEAACFTAVKTVNFTSCARVCFYHNIEESHDLYLVKSSFNPRGSKEKRASQSTQPDGVRPQPEHPFSLLLFSLPSVHASHSPLLRERSPSEARVSWRPAQSSREGAGLGRDRGR